MRRKMTAAEAKAAARLLQELYQATNQRVLAFIVPPEWEDDDGRRLGDIVSRLFAEKDRMRVVSTLLADVVPRGGAAEYTRRRGSNARNDA